MRYVVKICGTTNRADLELIAELGADYGGVLVDLPYSPRTLTLETARRLCADPPLPVVVLTFNKGAEENIRVVEALRPAAIQLQGQEHLSDVADLKARCGCEVWKALHLPFRGGSTGQDEGAFRTRISEHQDAGVDRIVLDVMGIQDNVQRFGGTGEVSDWGLVNRIKGAIERPFLLAGGIRPDNVLEALGLVNPSGFDLCSGVEREVGKKDRAKIRRLITLVRGREI